MSFADDQKDRHIEGQRQSVTRSWSVECAARDVLAAHDAGKGPANLWERLREALKPGAKS